MQKPSPAKSKSRSASVDVAAGRVIEAKRIDAAAWVKRAEKAFTKASQAVVERQAELDQANEALVAANSEVAAFVRSHQAALLSDDRAFQLLLDAGEPEAQLPL